MSTSPRLKRKKLTLTLKVKDEIIKRIDQGESYNELSTEFGIGRSTIYDIYKNRTNIEKAAKKPYILSRRTLRAAEHPVLEDKLYEWYMAERHLYTINGSLMILKAKTIHKELTGKDDFQASSGWLDRFKKRRGIVLGRGFTPAVEAGSSVGSTPEVPVVNATDEQGVIKVERTSSGDQLIIRVTDKQNSKSNVFNSFSVSDGHFENNIVVKEERDEPQPEDEEPETMETEAERSDSVSEALFPAAEALLGNQDSSSSEGMCQALKDLNLTLQRFVTEYAERTLLERERIDLDRARLQFDMEVFHRKKKENDRKGDS